MKTKFNKYWFAIALIIIANIFIFRVLAKHFSNYIDDNIAKHEGRADVELNPDLLKQQQETETVNTPVEAPTDQQTQ